MGGPKLHTILGSHAHYIILNFVRLVQCKILFLDIKISVSVNFKPGGGEAILSLFVIMNDCLNPRYLELFSSANFAKITMVISSTAVFW